MASIPITLSSGAVVNNVAVNMGVQIFAESSLSFSTSSSLVSGREKRGCRLSLCSPEELMTTPILQAAETLSPEAEKTSTALIAAVITMVFLTLLSVVILIFFYLYKNKGSYVTYEPAEGEPSAILQMESDSAKSREKEEYFI
ncbi:small cell adhesion glycoprotein isoform X1 [Castor canadensis]|uniref:Small cell adhesion glycoprotein isoform X1 n=2 Tax=Castor canadensis TaxID=51338 RepID=A0AC58NCW2_CASCN